MVILIADLLENNKSLKINAQNAKKKIFIQKISSVNPCIYHQSADHVIDVQCCGANSIVPADRLTKGSNEVDLMFLYDVPLVTS